MQGKQEQKKRRGRPRTRTNERGEFAPEISDEELDRRCAQQLQEEQPAEQRRKSFCW